MKWTFPHYLAAILCLMAFGAQAQTQIAECPKKYEPATLNLKVLVSTNLEACPLLEDKKLRQLVDENMFGTVFFYPAVPGTCVSGVIQEGSTIDIGEGPEAVTGYTESAQRFFPDGASVNPSGGGLFLAGTSQDGIPFASGAAATAVSLETAKEKFKLTVLVSDRFTVNGLTGIDTEDFEVIGASKGDAIGRLTGIAQITAPPPAPIFEAPFQVQGQVCIK